MHSNRMVFVQLLPPKQPLLQLLALRRFQRHQKSLRLPLRSVKHKLIQQRQQHRQRHLHPNHYPQHLQHVEIVKSSSKQLKLQPPQKQQLQKSPRLMWLKRYQVVQKPPLLNPCPHYYNHRYHPHQCQRLVARQRKFHLLHYLHMHQQQQQLRQQCKR